MKTLSLLIVSIALSFLSEEAFAGACPRLRVSDVNAIADHLIYEGWVVTDSTNHPIQRQVFSESAEVSLRAGSVGKGACQYNIVVWPENLNANVILGRFEIHKPI